MQELELDLDVYQGPFDLLFTLILREEVDIFEVPLLQVILAYLEDAAVSQPAFDWEGLSEFLVLISSLLELKSRFLLPGQEVGEEALDPRTGPGDAAGPPAHLPEVQGGRARSCAVVGWSNGAGSSETWRAGVVAPWFRWRRCWRAEIRRSWRTAWTGSWRPGRGPTPAICR